MQTIIKKEVIPFTQVANEVLYDPNLSFKAKGVYAYLYSKPDGWDFAIDRIALETKEGRKAINAAMHELEEHGYLYRARQKSGRVAYILKSQMPKMGTRPHAPFGQVPKRPSAEMGTVSNTDNKVILSNSNTDTSSPTKLVQEQAFEEFWAKYPRKVGKQAAKSKWLRLNPSCELKEKILAAVENHANTDQWKRERGQFIPHPTTWLNQGRWDDVVECAQQPSVLDFRNLQH